MIQRGKFRSLTLINWNGFFARTFDLDELVTTLSGGNGAGKSTTMAAFVTALIPDLTLLHFRNTTEAGATSGSRDKGLHGKLRPGVCYAVLDVLNSRHARVLAGVRLQQVAGRDRKVDIKPFAITGLPMAQQPTQLLTGTLNERQARVLNLQELKEKVEELEGVQFRQFNSITDYHALMFELGIVARRLRTAADRSKYYRLIEASLYGGISSAITRSLRDYLLPENSGVRKAFQDMEAALRENRMTLEAIRITQADRDLFKQLITGATHYVAADYMRHANERRGHLEQALVLRKALFNSRQQLANEQYRHIEAVRELEEYTAAEADLQADHQAASDHLSLVQTALRQQEKIERYQVDVEELRFRLEEQSEVVAEAEQQQQENEARASTAEQEVDELKSQLANYQQALDVQQTRAIQYQQALQAQQRAQTLCQLSDLNAENVDHYLAGFRQQAQQATERLLLLEQKMQVAQTAHSQFAQAYQLVSAIRGSEPHRQQAWELAQHLLSEAASSKHLMQQVSPLSIRQAELEQRVREQQEARRLLAEFCKRQGQDYTAEQLASLQQQLDAQLADLTDSVAQASEQRLVLRQQLQQIQQQIQEFTRRAPAWLTARESLTQLAGQSGENFTCARDVTEYLQQLMENERQISIQRDEVSQHKRQIDDEIEQLSLPGGSEDVRLNALAERFSGVLLAEIYDDVSLEDAPYYSALYGPSRHAIVVPDLSRVRDQLDNLDDCPEDLYLIEGDPQAFDDNVFSVEELNHAVVIKVADRQWRYSRFPAVPIFGRAARENRIDSLHRERNQLAERYATLSFDVQKLQRLHQAFSQFVGDHLAVVFDEDPEAQIRKLNSQRNEIERELTRHDNDNQQQQTRFAQLQDGVAQLNRLLPRVHLLEDEQLADRQAEVAEQLEEARQAAQFLQQHASSLAKLEPIAVALQSDPQHYQQLQQDYQQAQQAQRHVQQQVFALSEVAQRRAHFSYSDAEYLQSDNNDLNDQLRKRLELAQAGRDQARLARRDYGQQLSQYQQLLASLKSAFDAKNDMLNELNQELAGIGVQADSGAQERARLRRDELHVQLTQNRTRRNQLEKQLTRGEAEMDSLTRSLSRLERDYCQMREQVVIAKVAWCEVLRLVKQHGMERRLHRRELAYLEADELRSMSDKALGALRLAVADNEHLRDVLRQSEDPKRTERKILFFIAVYQHLRERIRQDIIRTDDPLEAIEQMEIELSRLTEELTAREQKLAISSRSVANIIRKTIQREQNRIRMLNQGLQSVSFGQVNSVRLNVNVRESHATLLEELTAQHEQHQDLFNSNRLTFSEALAKLYQRLNPQLDAGNRTAQTIGEELLDYRNYLEMEVEVNRGSDGWLRAESGALSTGEAIGTGMSILVMVVQSWEDESRRLRGKDLSPCRLLFLDEAARLDARSITTLFELCERLDMQLIIAAPENISPEKGTTYKLVRKVFNNQEHVHVVGLRGFAGQSTVPETQAD